MKQLYLSTQSKKRQWLHAKLSVIILTVSLLSCQEPMENIDTGMLEPVLLVEGKITTDTTKHYVLLSQSGALNDTNTYWVSDAEVTISGNNQTIELFEESPGHYYTAPDIYGVIGRTYELTIALQNGESYTAQTSISNIPEIDSVKIAWENWSGYGDYLHFVYYHGWELQEEGNAYLWNLFLNDTLYNDTLFKTTFVEDDFVNGNYIGYGAKRYYDSLNNQINTQGSNFAIYALGPEEINSTEVDVLVEMESIPLAYYEFWTSFMSQTVWVGSPFDPAKADLLNNISNGALGYFYGASVKRYRFKYIPPDWSLDYRNSN
ncbi:MAG TPA: hypothetical protein DDX98_14690 [Bacteroidales bacterium]|jgi:hypothetical protein|nr:hypothetical protein [Bacteroidales bacterium]